MFSGISEFVPVARLWASSSKTPDSGPPGVQNSALLTHKSSYGDSLTEPSSQQGFLETKNIQTPRISAGAL